MCLSKAFIIEKDRKRVLCERVKTMEYKDGRLILKDLFDESWEVDARIDEINFVDNYIILKDLKTAETI